MTTPCLEWTGKIGTNGYGYRGDRLAHRIVWEEANGPISPGLELDHLCRNRRCVNLDHLEPVTHAENVRRGIAGQVNRERMLARTHCAQGHEWTPENTRQTPRQRKCRQCERAACARWRAKRRAAR